MDRASSPGPDRRWLAWLGLALVAAGVAFRLFRFALDFPIWGDEAGLALNFVERDYRGLLRELNHWQIAPILFLWFEKAVFDLFGPSTAALRLLPLLASVGGLVLFWPLARRVLPPHAAVFAVGLLAVSDWPIELASTLKSYSLDLFFGVLLIRLAERSLRAPRRVVWLALAVPFAVGLSYPAVFVAGAVSLVLVPSIYRERSLRVCGWFVAYNLLLVGCFVAHLLLVGREKDPLNPPELLAYMKTFWKHGFPPESPLPAAWWAVRVHFGKLMAGPVQVNGAGAVGLALVLVGVRSLFRAGNARLALLCLLPFALHLLAALLRRYPYGMHPRLEQHLAPAYCLLCGSGLATVVGWLARTAARQRRLVLAGAGGLALIGVVVSARDLASPQHDEVALWARQVADHLRREMRPDDRFTLAGPADHVCLRWQLLPLADRRAASVPATGRLWVVEVRIDERPVGAPEPEARIAGEAITRRRFRGAIPDSNAHAFRCFCDVYLLPPNSPRPLAAR